jgi:hypothetical protein
MVGGALLAISVFLSWYETSGNGQIDGLTGTLSGWDVHTILRWLLLLASAAPFILAYIIVFNRELSWARGEMTAVVSIAVLGLVFYNGVIDRPGDPSSSISLSVGWFGALLGTMLMLFGAALRSSDQERRRKPPGTI